MLRREFIKNTASVLLVLSGGEIVSFFDKKEGRPPGSPVMRFIVASDGHYGQDNTAYENYFQNFVAVVNALHRKQLFDFCVINGDIIHDDRKWFQPAKAALDNLEVKYYVSQGNHDHATAQEWEEVWKMPVNFDFTFGKNAMLIGTTSNEQGTYLCPDMNWFSQKLKEYKKKKNIFVFIHINPGKLTKHAVDCPNFFELLSHHKNVRAIFNGHDHDEDGIKRKGRVPFIFDAHFGGSWGTSYRGFRVVELYRNNSMLTYVLNPAERINEQTL